MNMHETEILDFMDSTVDELATATRNGSHEPYSPPSNTTPLTSVTVRGARPKRPSEGRVNHRKHSYSNVSIR